MLPFPRDARLADRSQNLFISREIFLDAPVEILVLEIENRIVVPDRGFDQALRIPRRGRTHDLESGSVQKGCFRILGVKRSSPDVAARRAPHDDWRREIGAVPSGRNVVGKHVVGARDEVNELHLAHRAHPHVGGAGGGTHDGSLGDRCVDHPPGAEPGLKPFGHLEGTPVGADILAEDEDPLVPLHFLPEPLAERLEIGDFRH